MPVSFDRNVLTETFRAVIFWNQILWDGDRDWAQPREGLGTGGALGSNENKLILNMVLAATVVAPELSGTSLKFEPIAGPTPQCRPALPALPSPPSPNSSAIG